LGSPRVGLARRIKEIAMSEAPDDRTLAEWSERLTQALQILDLRIDHALLLELAEKSSTRVTPSAGPMSTFFVGYAAGVAATSGVKEARAAVDTAARTALLVVEEGIEGESPAARGWSDTAQ